MNKALSYTATGLKLLLGVFFMISALAKFVSVDNFNIYVFSFGMLSFRMSVLIGWLAISTELLLGIALLSGRLHRWVCLSATLLLLVFSFFLLYSHFIGRTDSCHCMGDLLPFEPLRSILKNSLLLLLILFVWKFALCDWRPRWWLTLPLVVAAQAFMVLAGYRGWIHMNYYDLQYSSTLMGCCAVVVVLLSFGFSNRWWIQLIMAMVPYVTVFILSTAACLMPVEGSIPVNTAILTQETNEGQLANANINDGHKVVAFYSKGCNYCRRASEKLSMIQQRHDLPEEAFVTVFPSDTIHGLDKFYDTPYAKRFSLNAVSSDSFLKITCGRAPLIILMNNGKIEATYGSGYLSESEVTKFLTQK